MIGIEIGRILSAIKTSHYETAACDSVVPAR